MPPWSHFDGFPYHVSLINVEFAFEGVLDREVVPFRHYHRLLSLRLVLLQDFARFLDFGSRKFTERYVLLEGIVGVDLDSVEEGKAGERLHIRLRKLFSTLYTLDTEKGLTFIHTPICFKLGSSLTKPVNEAHGASYADNGGAYGQ